MRPPIGQYLPQFMAKFIPWPNVLMAYGVIPDTDGGLPATASCPFCKPGAMRLLSDFSQFWTAPCAGVWCYCPHCEWSGDLLELGTKLWKLDTRSVLLKLRTRGVAISDQMLEPAVLDSYETSTLVPRRELQTTWSKASRYTFQDNSELLWLHDHFGLHSRYNERRWPAHMGRIVGGLISDECDMPKVRRALGEGSLIVPAWDLPGRLCGLWVISRRKLDQPEFHPLRNNTLAGTRDTGFAFFEAATYHHRQFGETVFAISDLALALRLHGRHFREHDDRLPVIFYHDGAPGAPHQSWNRLPKQDLILWSPTPDRVTFKHAARTGARLVVSPFKQENLRYHLAWLRRVRESAKPWQETFYELLPDLPDHQVEDILLNLDLASYDDWRQLRDLCPKEELTRLDALRVRKWGKPTVFLSRHNIVETKDGYFTDVTNELICDAVIRLKYAVGRRSKKNPTAYYYGWFRYKGVKFPIRGATCKLRKQIFPMMEAQTVAAGLGVPRCCPIWKFRLLELALRMHPPKMIRMKRRRKLPKGQQPLPPPT